MTENLMADADALSGTDVDRRPGAGRGWPRMNCSTVATTECGGGVRVAWFGWHLGATDEQTLLRGR